MLLAAAVGDRAAPLRTPVVATAGNGGADARVMVLRAVDRGARTLTFFTDGRAAKVGAVIAAPRVAVVAWDAGTGLQLRLRGTATVATAGAAVAAWWARVPEPARRAYRTAPAPGTPLPSADFAEASDDAFAVVTVVVDHLDWLDLEGRNHRRAAHAFRDDVWSATWLVP